MKLKMCRTQRVLALLTMYLGLVHSWDFALSVGDELWFYTNNTRTNTVRFESQNLTALAFDEVHDIILYVDKQTNGDAICTYSLSSVENQCLIKRTGRNIHGIAFDPVTDTVFFTDTTERTVNWINLKPGSENNATENLLIKMDKGIPRDIVVDSCKRYVYWLNTDMAKPTIERVRLSGADREIYETITSLPFNATHKLEPHSLALDQQTQTIHWIEPKNTKIYNLFSSTLYRKTKNNVIVKYLVDYPMFINPLNTLAVLRKTEIAVEFQYLNRRVYQYSNEYNKIEEMFVVRDKKVPIGIVANYKIADQIQGRQDCEELKSRIEIPAEYDATFCVHGVKVDGQSVCKCAVGYIGERCDVYVCKNYCLQGNCSVDNEGLPECRCDAGYTGVRCDVSVCKNYCLQGNCSVDNEGLPECSCDAGYTGVRCDVSVCKNYCLQGNCSVDNEGLPECRCDAGYTGVRCDVSRCENYCVQGNCSVDNEGLPECRCDAGYTGVRCDVSRCENYCLQGNCSVDNEGLPECSCDAGYSGVNCQISSCHGYCLNGGDCLLNEEEEPVCQCVGNFEGTRCEAEKRDTLTYAHSYYLKERNLTLADLLSSLREVSSTKFVIIEV